MADYCVASDVQARIPDVPIDDSTSKVSLATVTAWISQVTGALNVAYVSGGGVLPITDADRLAAMKMLESGEVAFMVHGALGVAKDPKVEPLSESWHDDYVKALELMRSGDWSVDAPTDTPDSYTRDADSSDPSDDRNPVFTKDYVP